MFALPNYVWVLIVIGAIAIRWLVGESLYRSALAAGLGRRTAKTVAVSAVALLFGWLAVSALLAYHGAYRSGPGVPLAIFGVLAALLASARIPTVARALAAPGVTARLVWPQSVRAAGVTFLIVMFLGKLPALFALPAGLGDLSVGLAAPFVARSLAAGTGHRRAFWFNVLGIVDLVVAFTTSTLSGLAHISPSNDALALLPLALIPTTAVPLTATLHILSLRRLARTPANTPRPTGMAAASR